MEIEEPYVISFRDPEWLLSHPEGLTLENVLDYFAESPFWDPQSNNEVLKMQTKFNSLPDQRPLDITKMTGIEFCVVRAVPPSFFLIQKRRRISEVEARPLATYFIIRGIVYQSPDLYTVIGNRIYTSLYHLHKVFNNIHEHVNFHPATGYIWKSDKDEGSSRALPLLDKDLIEFRQAADLAYYSVTRRLHEERERAIKSVEEDNERERERMHKALLLQQQAVLEEKATEGSSEEGHSTKKKDSEKKKRRRESNTGTKKKKKKHEKKFHRLSNNVDADTLVKNILSRKSSSSSIPESTPDGSFMDF